MRGTTDVGAFGAARRVERAWVAITKSDAFEVTKRFLCAFCTLFSQRRAWIGRDAGESFRGNVLTHVSRARKDSVSHEPWLHEHENRKDASRANNRRGSISGFSVGRNAKSHRVD